MYIYNYKNLNASASESLLTWINYQQPLTDKLSGFCTSVELKLMSQQWVKPSWWDKYALSLNSSNLLQREIIMYSGVEAYWYARTLIPQACYEQNPGFFKRLEQESLKHLIFDNIEVKRINRVFYPIDATCIEYHWVKKYLQDLPTHLWVRLSQYSYQDSQFFYLIELLFPKLGDLST